MKESKCFLPKQGFNAFFPQAITGLQAVGRGLLNELFVLFQFGFIYLEDFNLVPFPSVESGLQLLFPGSGWGQGLILRKFM